MSDTEEMQLTTEFEVLSIHEESHHKKILQIATEVPLVISANGTELATIMSSPCDLRELVYGFLFTSGFIHKPAEVLSCELNRDNMTMKVELARSPDPEQVNRRIYTAGCGKGVMYFDEKGLPSKPPFDVKGILTKNQIFDLMKWFQTSGGLHKRIRGAHTAAMSVKGESPDFGYDDVGRHNAVDKVIGRALLEQYTMEECILLASGRVSTEITHKAIKAGVPVVLSLGTPTHHAILLARTMNLTLMGSARGRQVSVFTGVERINF
ncbi:formate dehydrogenase accessory sulfurtransferase FdhD [Fibrobacterota bacterium]